MDAPKNDGGGLNLPMADNDPPLECLPPGGDVGDILTHDGQLPKWLSGAGVPLGATLTMGTNGPFWKNP